MITLSWDIRPTVEFYAFDIGLQTGVFVSMFPVTRDGRPATYGIFSQLFDMDDPNVLKERKKDLLEVHASFGGTIRSMYRKVKSDLPGEDDLHVLTSLAKVLRDQDMKYITHKGNRYTFGWSYLDDDLNTRKI